MAPQPISQADPSPPLLTSRTKRLLLENLKAYAFVAPAMILLFAFGIFPILYAAYVSLFRWRIRQGDFVGLRNYVEAMGDVAYVFFGLVALGLVFTAASTLTAALRTARERNLPLHYPLLSLVPAAVIVSGATLLLLRALTLFAQQETYILGNAPLGLALVIGGGIGAWYYNQTQHRRLTTSQFATLPNFVAPALTVLASAGLAIAILYFTYHELLISPRAAVALIRIRYLSFGLGALVAAYFIWTWSMSQASTVKLIGGLVGAIALMAAGVNLVTIWPSTRAESDPDFYFSLLATVFYALGTVPFQLGISMILAILLFQNIKGKGVFRVLFFIPYIAPTVATAGIFEAIFSIRPSSLANLPFTQWGVNPAGALKWLREAGPAIAKLGEAMGIESMTDITWGPSLALFVVILFNIWVFVGYDTVIFLAGLGNIPNTLYEAAKIDGAGRWALFRYITLPLLSPTTYFLSVISIIGTFKAFNHIWVLRDPAAQGTIDTASIYFFQTFFRGQRFGYATAMAIVLFVIILVMTIIQNRVAQKKVFYG
ncbi:MAG: sugar ABC transporter permease [Chloroflexi bacterium]|nr:sugar ABC transporter permease [Chloroflexota bacterium]